MDYFKLSIKPNRPCYSKDEITIADILKDFPEVMVMSDDIYEHKVYDNLNFILLLKIKMSLIER